MSDRFAALSAFGAMLAAMPAPARPPREPGAFSRRHGDVPKSEIRAKRKAERKARAKQRRKR